MKTPLLEKLFSFVAACVISYLVGGLAVGVCAMMGNDLGLCNVPWDAIHDMSLPGVPSFR